MELSAIILIVVFLLLLFYTGQQCYCSKKNDTSTYVNYVHEAYNNGSLNYAMNSTDLTSAFYSPAIDGLYFIGGNDDGGGCADGDAGGDCDGDGGDF